jgi:hypothetical protein
MCGSIAKIESLSNAGGRAAYKVTPEAKGDCIATVTGANGSKADLPISVAPPGDVLVNPGSLDFDLTGPEFVRNVGISQMGFIDAFTETDTCSGIATVVSSTNANGAATYRVAPVAGGTCTATFHGGHTETAPLSIAVTPPGKIVALPTSLSFDAVGSGAAKPVTVSQSGFAGSFGESDGCSNIASVFPSKNQDGNASYTVTPLANGTCIATFSGANKEIALLAISVAVPLPGDVSVTPHSLTLFTAGPGGSQQVKVTQLHYDGAFTEKNTCAGIAVIASVNTASGGAAEYSATAIAKGTCTAIFTGGDGKSAPLSVMVLAPVEVQPDSLTFVHAGSGAARHVAVTQSGFTGAFTESDTCKGIATVSQQNNTGGTASYMITPIGNGDCVATFTGGDQQSAPLSVAVKIIR